MNESRPMGNRTPPRERGEWGTESRRKNAASGEPNAAAGARRVGTRRTERRRKNAASVEPDAAAGARRVGNRTPPRERGEWEPNARSPRRAKNTKKRDA